ncbi:MFS transporter M6 [Pseudocercospora fuligena]|uniref:MFS transporter M6 n=1 Tax=Pseudocercospora fuligena TaxID=685502 RepID=A0A8H6VB80_9PEZI|nr:MFS transporter M6 [Pseudocercospora fuligena]
MEKRQEAPTALVVPEDRMPGEEEVESPADGNEAEGNAAPKLELQRTVSGPPYSIFTPRAKIFIVVAVSISSLISPFGATTFYPALDVIARDLGVTPTLINLSLTTYMIAQAIAPALIAGMSDTNGRRLSYIVCFIIFLVANIGLALQTNYAALLVLRMVQAFGCSAAIALSNAVVADIATSAERGKYMGYATAGLLFGPAFGPTIGGLFAQYLGWRWTFWFLVIFSGFLLVVFTLFFPETCRNVVGNGSIPAKGVNQSILGYLQQRHHRLNSPDDASSFTTTRSKKRSSKLSLPNPLQTLAILTDKESSLILLYNGLFFTGMMVVTASIPTLYESLYHLNTLYTGLCYISMGMGSLASTLTTGHVVDWNFRRHARKLGLQISKTRQQDLSNFPIERVRFEVVVPGHIIGTIGILIFGWTLNFHTSLAGPEVALFLIGFGVSTAFNITNTLLIDLHRDQPATATAAVNFVRCLMSAGGAAAIIPMCNAMGIGWAFTFLALVYVVLIAAVFWLMKAGMRWREEKRERKKEQKRQLEDEREREVEQEKSDEEDESDRKKT